MFRVKMNVDGREETIYNVISIETFKDEDENQVILRFDNGTGTIFEPENNEYLEVMWYL